jgi:hypothetical protein
MSTFNELIDFTRSTTGTYLDSVVYGPELVTNGTFDSNVDGWPVNTYGTIAYSNGTAILTNTDGVYRVRANQAIGTEIGKTYVLTYSATGNYNFLHIGSEHFNIGIGQDGPHSKTFVAVSNNTNIQIGLSTTAVGFSSTFDNVSVKEVTGGQVSGTPLLRTAAINEPRLEYDASGNPLGLLIEEARTNVLVYSENFTSGWSSPFCDATANAIASPDGALSGAKLQEDSSGVTGPRLFPNNNAVLTANQAQTLSCFFKAGTSAYAYLTIRYSNGNVAAVEFDLTSGTVNSTTVAGNMTLNSSDITSAGNGWYRCSVTATSSASTTAGFYFLAMTDGSGVTVAGYPNYTLTGKNIYAWGAQVETGSFPTSYIPTSGSTVTRAADVASLPVERFAYNQTQGSVVVQTTYTSPDAPTVVSASFGLDDGTSSNRMWYYANKGQWIGSNSGLTTFSVSSLSYPTIDVLHKSSMAYKANDFPLVIDGAFIGIDTSSPVPVVNFLGIGKTSLGTYLNGHIKSIQYYPKRLSNEELQLLTQPSASPTMNLTFDGQATSTLVEGLHD